MDSACLSVRHIYVKSLSFFENRAFYEITNKNIVQPVRPQKTKWRISNACWITKATNTNSEHVILTALPL